MRFNILALAALIVAFGLSFTLSYKATVANRNQAPEMIFGNEINSQLDSRDALDKRDFIDTYQVFNRIRNAHACIMSIVFIVLFPLGAIAVHLPTNEIPFIKNTYLKQRILAVHMPIQMLGLTMMTGGMGLGIRMAYDLDYFTQHPTKAHVVIGLLVTTTLIVFQPAMGIAQHLYFRRTGGKSIFAYTHRWFGRCAIILGMINSGLGLQLAKWNGVVIHRHTYLRNFIVLGLLVAIWWGVVFFDAIRGWRNKRVTDGGEKGIVDQKKADSISDTAATGARGEVAG